MARMKNGNEMGRVLASGYILHNSYVIEEVLGEGGFGITYAGRQLNNGKKVAIKEYSPCAYANQKGKEYFLKEAGILREFQYLEGLVYVMDCFQENNTAYIVMEYIEGITLEQYVKEYGCLTVNEVMELFTPVMKALIQIHRQGLIHRDISPDNLLIGLDNKMRLIDFGAAREAGTDKQNRTVILKAGYAPPEQYVSDGKQGAWTDVYGLCATMYMALSGKKPVDSLSRVQGTPLVSLYPEFTSKRVCEVIEQGMALKVSKRYKNVDELYEAMVWIPDKEDSATVMDVQISLESQGIIRRLNQRRELKYGFFLIVLLVVAVVCGILQYNSRMHGQMMMNQIMPGESVLKGMQQWNELIAELSAKSVEGNTEEKDSTTTEQETEAKTEQRTEGKTQSTESIRVIEDDDGYGEIQLND